MKSITDRYIVQILPEAITVSKAIHEHLDTNTIALIATNGCVMMRPAQHGDEYVYTLAPATRGFTALRFLQDTQIAQGSWLVRLLPNHAVELVRQPREDVLNLPHIDPSLERSWLTADQVKRELGITDRAFRVYLEDDTIRATPLDQIPNPPKRIHGHTKYLVGRKELDRFLRMRREEFGPVE